MDAFQEKFSKRIICWSFCYYMLLRFAGQHGASSGVATCPSSALRAAGSQKTVFHHRPQAVEESRADLSPFALACHPFHHGVLGSKIVSV